MRERAESKHRPAELTDVGEPLLGSLPTYRPG
jgi:hypothetical protein